MVIFDAPYWLEFHMSLKLRFSNCHIHTSFGLIGLTMFWSPVKSVACFRTCSLGSNFYCVSCRRVCYTRLHKLYLSFVWSMLWAFLILDLGVQLLHSCSKSNNCSILVIDVFLLISRLVAGVQVQETSNQFVKIDCSRIFHPCVSLEFNLRAEIFAS